MVGGHLILEVELEPWHELIHATRWPHVRKGTVFGLGRVDIKLNQVIFLPIK